MSSYIVETNSKSLDNDTKHKEISEIFPYYLNDVSFGGTKQYIMIIDEDNKYYIYYIDPNNEDKQKLDCYSIIDFKNINIKYLISKNIIELNKVYDINSFQFIKQMMSHKINIQINDIDKNIINKIRLTDEYLYNFNEIIYKIKTLLINNIIINNEFYGVLTLYDRDYIDLNKLENFNNFEENKCISLCMDVTVELDVPNTFNFYKKNNEYYYSPKLFKSK
jgi:hypothetical protein